MQVEDGQNLIPCVSSFDVNVEKFNAHEIGRFQDMLTCSFDGEQIIEE